MKNTSPEHVRKTMAALDESIALHYQIIETQVKLKKTIALLLVDQTVHEGGKVRTTVRGLMPSSLYGDLPDSRSVFIIKREGVPDVEVPFTELPIELWPDEMVERIHKRTMLRELMVRRGFKQFVKEDSQNEEQ